MVAIVSCMASGQLTKQDIRDLLNEHTEQVIRPLTRQDMRELLDEHTHKVIRPMMQQDVREMLEAHTEHVIKPFIVITVKTEVKAEVTTALKHFENRIVSQLADMLQGLVNHMDERFDAVEQDIRFIKKELIVQDEQIDVLKHRLNSDS